MEHDFKEIDIENLDGGLYRISNICKDSPYFICLNCNVLFYIYTGQTELCFSSANKDQNIIDYNCNEIIIKNIIE